MHGGSSGKGFRSLRVKWWYAKERGVKDTCQGSDGIF